MAREDKSRRRQRGSRTKVLMITIHALLRQRSAGAPHSLAIDEKESPMMMAYESAPTTVLNVTVAAGSKAERSPKILAHVAR